MMNLKKGMNVYLIRTDWRTGARTVDKETRYIIRSIGQKQAIIDNEKHIDDGFTRRGRAFYLTPQEDIDRYTIEGREVPSYFIKHWSEHFVVAGLDGWDAEENF